MAHLYAAELHIAQLAVQRATLLTRRVFDATSEAKHTLDKADHSPVTVGDLGAQALIIVALRHRFPADAIVAEEEASALRRDPALREVVWDLVRSTRLESGKDEEDLGGSVVDANAMLDLLDAGGANGGPHGRFWAIDPIDGTKGFLRGGQYAVCLALIVDGDVKLGVLGCPNLPVDDAVPLTVDIGTVRSSNPARDGVLFTAVQGQGANSRLISTGALSSAQVHPIKTRSLRNITEATFCESVESAHSSHDDQALIRQRLGITQPSVRMDSQAKYGSIARGAGDIYLRLPVKASYQEKIWDHAAGDLIVREAGGQVTDIYGRRLDFSAGRALNNNRGVVAAPASVHATVLQAVQEVLGSKQGEASM